MKDHSALILYFQSAGIPLFGVTITLHDANGKILAHLQTDRHGITKRKPILTDAPRVDCYIDAQKSGFFPLSHMVFPLYRGITCVHAAELFPL